MSEGFDSVTSAEDHVKIILFNYLVKRSQVEHSVLLEQSVAVGEGRQIIYQPHRHGQPPVQRSSARHIYV